MHNAMEDSAVTLMVVGSTFLSSTFPSGVLCFFFSFYFSSCPTTLPFVTSVTSLATHHYVPSPSQ